LWNTVYLSRALDVVRRRGDLIPDALLAHLAPLGWQHINPQAFTRRWRVLSTASRDPRSTKSGGVHTFDRTPLPLADARF